MSQIVQAQQQEAEVDQNDVVVGLKPVFKTEAGVQDRSDSRNLPMLGYPVGGLDEK